MYRLAAISAGIAYAFLCQAVSASVYVESPPIVTDGLPGQPVRAVFEENRWQHLPRTMASLRSGGSLKIVALGDSIVNDTFAIEPFSVDKVAAHYGAEIDLVRSVRGSTGVDWYKQENRVQEWVLDHQPDLVMIGGISNHGDIDGFAEVIAQIRAAAPDTEFVLMSDAINRWKIPDATEFLIDLNDPGWRGQLRRLARDLGAGYIDMRGSYDNFVIEAHNTHGLGYMDFQRDRIHGNMLGREVTGTTVATFFLPDAVTAPEPAASLLLGLSAVCLALRRRRQDA